MSSNPNVIALIAAGLLIVFSIYRRMRRMIGRQLLSPRAMSLRMAMLGLICAVLVVWPQFKPLNVVYDLVAAALGAGLGYYGLGKTQFERSKDGAFYYTPHAYVGAAVVALFVARIAYRLLDTYTTMAAVHDGHPPAPPSAAATLQNPLTIAFYFALAGYYICFYAGILQQARKQPAVLPS